jgi:signal transduction histidine kinase
MTYERRPWARRGRPRRRPPWWPEGEPWPPSRPPWHAAPRRIRRRLLGALVLTLLILVAVGFVAGTLVATGRWSGPPGPHRGELQPRQPFALVGLIGVAAVVGSTATAVTYRRISRRLEAAEEQRRRFLADVTHELRTPLAVLQSGVEAQLDGIHPRDDQHLASLLEETQRLGHLVDDLHTLALADAGRLTLHREPRQLEALVEDAVGDHAALASRKQVVIRPSYAGDLPEVDVDPTRFRQILDNLLSNAVRHTSAGGEVRVTVEPEPSGGAGAGTGAAADRVRVTVADGGPGFPVEQLDHVFDRFSRPADTGSSSGLGLSIVHDLVRAHGGTIRAANRPGAGAVVVFTVPAVARPPRDQRL